MKLAKPLIAALIAMAVLPAIASAERPEPLVRFPGDGSRGAAAGQLSSVRAIAASPVNGHMYVADPFNARISEFTAWGGFVRSFGWGVLDGAPEPQKCTDATGCQQGIAGSGAGQIDGAGGMAVDSSGDVYLFEFANRRVTKWDADGDFLLMFGGEVNKTTGADVCTATDLDAGDECGIGVGGTGPGEFDMGLVFLQGSYLAVGPGDVVYVGDKDRVQKFDSNGSVIEQIPLPEPGNPRALAVDPLGNIFFAYDQSFTNEIPTKPYVFKLSPTGTELQKLEVGFPRVLTVDSESTLYVINGRDANEIVIFDGAGERLIPDAEEEAARKKEKEDKENGFPFVPFVPFGPTSDGTPLSVLAVNSACGAAVDDLYVGHFSVESLAYVQVYGPPPQDTVKCPPPAPLGPPEIAARYATEVGTDSATLQAEINPRYALDATYYLEYGTGKCSEGGCTEEEPPSPGQSLTTKVANAPVKSGGISLADLDPGTTYHYRFVAQSGAGGPVRSAEGSFTTFPPPPAPFTSCANQAFRIGPSALLANCRAYELVSPAERSPAGDIIASLNSLNFPAELNQSSTDGEKLAYSSEYAFADSLGAPYTSEYIATRVPGQEWSTHAISPPRESTLINKGTGIKVDIEEKAFTADLCRSWLMHGTDTPLADGPPPGFPRLYRRENCGPDADTYAPLETAAPPSIDPGDYWPELQGFSDDGSVAVFRANGKLTDDAPDLGGDAYANSGRQLYHLGEGGHLRFVCHLPDGDPSTEPCSAGTTIANGGDGRRNSVENALSADGSRVYWSTVGAGGALYLRENAGEEQSAMAAGKCTEENKACTYAVSSGAAQFWTALADGSKALYTQAGALREYDAATHKSKTIAQGALGVAGASEDLSRIYFASSKTLGGEGTEGKPNLYLSDEGQTELVATLAAGDMTVGFERLALNPVQREPIAHGARSTPDGRHLLFASSASLSGYDNLDAGSGEPGFEIYLYEAGSPGPVCLSCNPSGARPAARTFTGDTGETRPVAARIPAAPNQLYTPRVISSDGSRVFFESFEALVARDVNEAADVYEWQKAADEADCEAVGADLYVPASAGCLSLISSGLSDFDSTFLDSSEDGRDVFFKTDSSLVPQDHGLIDVYDAREGGGLPVPPAHNPGCVGEACQSPPPPPGPATPPTSAGFQGPGNVRQAGPKPKPCPKGKRRVVRGGKVRCVKPPRKHKRQNSNSNRPDRRTKR